MEEYDFYPEKPDLTEEKSKNNKNRSLISFALFVLTFIAFGGVNADLTFIAFIVSILLIHEMGHFLLMKLFGYKNVQINFIPFLGAFVRGKKESYKQKQSLFVVFAGPLPGIVIGIVLGYFAIQSDLDWLKSLSFLFLAINIINLLPIDPLDGGQILKLLIKKNQEMFQMVFSFVSSMVLIGVGFFFELWILVIFGFLMGIRVRAIQKKYHIHKELDEENINYRITYDELNNKDFARIKEIVFENTPALRNYVDQIPSEKMNPIVADQVNSVLIAPIERDTTFWFRFMTVVVWVLALISPIVLTFILNIKK